MSIDEITVLMRMSERLIGVLIGGMCVVLGYFLFSKLPEQTDSEGKIVLPGGVNIWLSRIGPGVFFAVFGAIIVGISLTSKVETSGKVENKGETALTNVTSKVTDSNPTVSTSTQTFRGVASSSPDMKTELTKAKTQVYILNRDWQRALQKELHPEDRKKIETAIDYSKRKIMQTVWQDKWGSFKEFEQWIDHGYPSPMSDSIKEPAEIYFNGNDEVLK